MKKIVIVRGYYGNFYLSPALEMVDSLSDNCIWYDTEEETIKNIIKEDMEKYDYELIAIEDFDTEEEE